MPLGIMLKVAITGNIASGKSEAEKIIQSIGYPVFDTDVINKDILENNQEIVEEIKSAFFSYDITDQYGSIDKIKLANVVFNNQHLKLILENILHRVIWEKLEEIFKLYSDKNVIFVSVPQLFEAGWEKRFDKIVFVSADVNTRLMRLIKRNNYTKEYAQKRIDAQQSEDIKIKKSDFVVFNNSDFSNLKNQITDILNKIVNL